MPPLRRTLQGNGDRHESGLKRQRSHTTRSRKKEVIKMPGTKHLRGVGEKEQRQYEHIKNKAKRSGRYGKRAEEVAARTVMKQHRQKGHRKGQ